MDGSKQAIRQVSPELGPPKPRLRVEQFLKRRRLAGERIIADRHAGDFARIDPRLGVTRRPRRPQRDRSRRGRRLLDPAIEAHCRIFEPIAEAMARLDPVKAQPTMRGLGEDRGERDLKDRMFEPGAGGTGFDVTSFTEGLRGHHDDE